MRATANLTPLMRAASTGNLESVRYFIEEEKIDVNALGPRASTALMFAAGSGHLNVVQLLIDAGADPYAVEDCGWTAAMLARDSGFEDVALFLDAFVDQGAAFPRRANA